MRKDLDDVIQGWPYDPEPGEVLAREVRARDGRSVLQIRIELGVLQLEVAGRPDGSRPHGATTYLDYLRHHAANRGPGDSGGPGWTMSQHHCVEADREFVQFYHRRMAWLSLRRYEMAVRDSDHTLALMDFVRKHGADEDYVASHEQFRGLVQFHRAQALAALALERRRPEEAIDALRDGVEKLTLHQRAWWDERDSSESPDPSLIEQLRLNEQEIRRNFAVEKTLREQLDEAVAREDYEQAARLRDQIQAQARGRR
ncbi:MAG: hypothetical protein BGO49_04545 [Planctomycetales bacterium 71-10]|nr:MAG: hypothetical protein BGO49_04545 [Planctomycetales bacterium 71-10]